MTGASPRVAVVGTFDPSYSRNRILLAVLERAGISVDVTSFDLWGSDRHTIVNRPKLGLALRAAGIFPRLAWRLLRAPRPNAYLVLYPGQLDMPLVGAIAWLRRVPTIFDIFISLHETIAGDRALRGTRSPAARLARLLDRLSCRMATLVLADTPPDAEFFADETGLDPRRIAVLWVGAQEDLYRPFPEVEPDPQLVFFHGTYIRLHGIETIVHAAKLLESDGIRFRLIGDGQERPAVEKLVRRLELTNLELVAPVPAADLAREIASAALCLGIFGTTPKASRVIPNKVFEYLAVGRPVVTADTPAIRSGFAGEVEVVPAGDPDALASRIRELLADPGRLSALAAAGHACYLREYSNAALAQTLASYIDEVVSRRATASSPGPRPGTSR